MCTVKVSDEIKDDKKLLGAIYIPVGDNDLVTLGCTGGAQA